MMKPLPLQDVVIDDSFFSARIDTARRVAIPYMWNALNDRIPASRPAGASRTLPSPRARKPARLPALCSRTATCGSGSRAWPTRFKSIRTRRWRRRRTRPSPWRAARSSRTAIWTPTISSTGLKSASPTCAITMSCTWWAICLRRRAPTGRQPASAHCWISPAALPTASTAPSARRRASAGAARATRGSNWGWRGCTRRPAKRAICAWRSIS